MQPLSAEAFTRLRYVAQTFGADGRPVAQTPTELAGRASVQPADPGMTCTDPGYSGQDRRRLFTFTELRKADETSGIPADRVTWDGATWLVWAVQEWTALGPLPRHWEADVYLVQPINP